MNKDQVKGRVEKAKGKVKEVTGKQYGATRHHAMRDQFQHGGGQKSQPRTDQQDGNHDSGHDHVHQALARPLRLQRGKPEVIVD